MVMVRHSSNASLQQLRFELSQPRKFLSAFLAATRRALPTMSQRLM